MDAWGNRNNAHPKGLYSLLRAISNTHDNTTSFSLIVCMCWARIECSRAFHHWWMQSVIWIVSAKEPIVHLLFIRYITCIPQLNLETISPRCGPNRQLPAWHRRNDRTEQPSPSPRWSDWLDLRAPMRQRNHGNVKERKQEKPSLNCAHFSLSLWLLIEF